MRFLVVLMPGFGKLQVYGKYVILTASADNEESLPSSHGLRVPA